MQPTMWSDAQPQARLKSSDKGVRTRPQGKKKGEPMTAGRTHAISSNTPLTPSLLWIATLRLTIGLGLVLGAATTLMGTAWDIQWHIFVGRDRTLIPPHLMMLSGITISGLLSLLCILFETRWVRSNPQLAPYTSSFARVFSGSLGAYVAGFAALSAAIAFPLDSYWHALYGVDVGLWAPFHVMIISSTALIPLGAAYLLQSATSLMRFEGYQRAMRVGQIGTVVALGTMMSLFSLLLSESLEPQYTLQPGMGVTISFFPALACLVTAFALSVARYRLPFRMAATSVLLIYLLFPLIFSAFVPPATSALVVSEGLSYRKELAEFAYLSIVAVSFWPLMPLVVAPLIDLCFWWARRRGWPERRLSMSLSCLALLSCWPLFAHPAFPLDFAGSLGPLGLSCSLLLGGASSFLGTWFGRATGEAIRQVER